MREKSGYNHVPLIAICCKFHDNSSILDLNVEF